MAMFKGFKPQGLQKIATRMGYAGSMENFDDYLKQNPDKEREMIVYRARAQEMARVVLCVNFNKVDLIHFKLVLKC